MTKRLVTIGAAAGHLFLLAGCATSVLPNASQVYEAPTGLWAWSRDTAADVRTVMVQREADGYQTRVDGMDVPMRKVDDIWRADLPNGDWLTIEPAGADDVISGTYLQPQIVEGVWYQNMATRFALKPLATDPWRSTVTIQARPHHIFVDFHDGAEGRSVAVIRNPEANAIGATSYAVHSDADKAEVTLIAGGDDGPRLQFRENDRGKLEHVETGRLFSPATREIESRYRSRTNGADVRFEQPPVLDDGWSAASAEEAGFDRAKLNALVAELAMADPRARRPQLLHSLLVSHRGKLVVEEYFYGHDREMRHDIRSLGKVFGSVMIGALRENGTLVDVDTPIVRETLEQAGLPLNDPRKSNITLHHMLTYTSGLDCAGDDASLGREDRMWGQEDETDFWLFTAKLPVLYPAGERYAYCSGSANLVGSALVRHGGKSVHALFDEMIAKPLDFGPYHWALAPNGEGYLGGGPYMRPRDVLKVGAMYAMGGRWNGQQIVPTDWVRESTSEFIEISPETTRTTREYFNNNYPGGTQGYIWRNDIVRAGDRSYQSYEASGNGGQLLIVVPELELAVAMTGGNYGQGIVWTRWRDEIVGGMVIPAMTSLTN